MSSARTLPTSLSMYLQRLSSLEEEVQVMSSEKANRTVEVETLQSVVKTLAGQVRYTNQKMVAEMEDMKLLLVEREEEVLEESLEGRLEKERNLAVIESARSEQTMLREAIRNLKIEKIRLLNRMALSSDRRQMAGVVREKVAGLDDYTNRLILAQQTDDKLGQELEQLISVAMEYQEKLDNAAKQIEKDIMKKGEIEMVFTSVKMEEDEVDSMKIELKEEKDASEVIETKNDYKKRLIVVKEKIRSVEKEIDDKSTALEEILKTVGSLVLADREKMKREEDIRGEVEQLKEKIVLEKSRISVKRMERIVQFREETDNLERKELALNISLANLNMDIERERTRRSRLDEEGMVGGDRLEETELLLESKKIDDELYDSAYELSHS